MTLTYDAAGHTVCPLRGGVRTYFLEKTTINQRRQERPRYLSTDQPDTRSRSLLSRSRVNRAVEAARRVGGGLIVAALNVGGLRAGAGAPTDAGSERPAGREGDRRAEQGGTPLRGPARLVKQPVRHSARDPSRELSGMKVCASEPRAPRTLTAKVRSRKRGAPGRWAGMVYWLGARVRSRWRCAAPREVSVCWRAT